jgi:glycosyltransferase involved in cell wall biosynthesis
MTDGSDRFTVLYTGRLASDNGVGLLAQAFLAAQRRDARLHLVLAGDGPEELALRCLLGGAATFVGSLDRDELAHMYANADVFLSPSQTEAAAEAIHDAQTHGVPVLAGDAGGAARLISHGRTGLLVPPDVEALSTALLMLAHRPPLRTQLSRGALAAVGFSRVAA